MIPASGDGEGGADLTVLVALVIAALREAAQVQAPVAVSDHLLEALRGLGDAAPHLFLDPSTH